MKFHYKQLKSSTRLSGRILTFLAATLIGAVACSSGEPTEELSNGAYANLKPTRGNTAVGTVTFLNSANGVDMQVLIRGLSPGAHGFHVHENGDCTSDDGSSAGGHYAPEGHSHGAPTDANRHTGDLGNVIANENGFVELTLTDRHLALTGPNSIIGRAIVVHGGADDLKSQPSGAAGPRVACGVVVPNEQ